MEDNNSINKCENQDLESVINVKETDIIEKKRKFERHHIYIALFCILLTYSIVISSTPYKRHLAQEKSNESTLTYVQYNYNNQSRYNNFDSLYYSNQYGANSNVEEFTEEETENILQKYIYGIWEGADGVVSISNTSINHLKYGIVACYYDKSFDALCIEYCIKNNEGSSMDEQIHGMAVYNTVSAQDSSEWVLAFDTSNNGYSLSTKYDIEYAPDVYDNNIEKLEIGDMVVYSITGDEYAGNIYKIDKEGNIFIDPKYIVGRKSFYDKIKKIFGYNITTYSPENIVTRKHLMKIAIDPIVAEKVNYTSNNDGSITITGKRIYREN